MINNRISVAIQLVQMRMPFTGIATLFGYNAHITDQNWEDDPDRLAVDNPPFLFETFDDVLNAFSLSSVKHEIKAGEYNIWETEADTKEDIQLHWQLAPNEPYMELSIIAKYTALFFIIRGHTQDGPFQIEWAGITDNPSEVSSDYNMHDNMITIPCDCKEGATEYLPPIIDAFKQTALQILNDDPELSEVGFFKQLKPIADIVKERIVYIDVDATSPNATHRPISTKRNP